MENTINGENASTAAKPVTEASLETSQPSGKKNTKKTKQPITPAEAAELLTSALSYCLESGLMVVGYNEGTELRLSISGLEYRDSKIQPVTLTGEINVTPAEVEK
jgi:hypothetical protein